MIHDDVRASTSAVLTHILYKLDGRHNIFTMSRAIKAALGRMERYVLSPVCPGRRDKILRGNGVFGMTHEGGSDPVPR
ncbi:hypothetical protein E4U23_006378 [Claviceps purpurea]|nr:hypothetical protein E4U23_006378 [Claviceps purpurea]